MFFLLTRPGRPPPNGDFNEKSMCFWESKRTTNDGILTTCLRTLEVNNKQRYRILQFQGKLKIDSPNVTLSDQHTCMMVGFSQSQFKYLGLQTSFQEILDFQTEHVIELHPGFIQDSNANQATQQSVTWNL